MIDTSGKAADIMTRHLVTAHHDHTFTELCRLLFEVKVHHLPVVDDQQRLLGIISANDALRAFSYNLSDLTGMDEAAINRKIKVEDLMTTLPFTVQPDTPVEQVMAIFAQHSFQSLPVVEAGRLVGIITVRGLIKGLP